MSNHFGKISNAIALSYDFTEQGLSVPPNSLRMVTIIRNHMEGVPLMKSHARQSKCDPAALAAGSKIECFRILSLQGYKNAALLQYE